MGVSQSTARAAKFSGSRRSKSTDTSPAVRLRRTPSNTNRNVKEFASYWNGRSRHNSRSPNITPGSSRRSSRRNQAVQEKKSSSKIYTRSFSTSDDRYVPNASPALFSSSARQHREYATRPPPSAINRYLKNAPNYAVQFAIGQSAALETNNQFEQFRNDLMSHSITTSGRFNQ